MQNLQSHLNNGKVLVSHFGVAICIGYLCCCVDCANVIHYTVSLNLVSRRDEVAGIRAKFPSKIPVSMIWRVFRHVVMLRFAVI